MDGFHTGAILSSSSDRNLISAAHDVNQDIHVNMQYLFMTRLMCLLMD